MTMTCVALLALAGCAKSRITQLADGMVDSMAKGDFAAATKDFDSKMNSVMSAQQLGQTWSQLTAQTGVFKSRNGSREVQEAGFQIVYVTCQFEKTMIDIKVVFDKDGKIGGLWFVPHVSAGGAKYSPPAYTHKDRFVEREITVGSGEWQLPGTLTIPKGEGPFPAVVLVHGSGPNDRDETIGPNKPFKDIAWGLASQGIAVLRYDKRTYDKSTKAKLIQNADNFTVKEEVIDDALAAVDLLRQSKEIAQGKVFVLGHSLGGMLIPRIGSADPKIAGLIVMAGSTRPLEDVMLDQIMYIASLNEPMTDDIRKEIDNYKQQIAIVKNLKPSAKSSASSLIIGVPASYWLDLRGYSPAVAAKSLKQPMLIVQGGRDYQSTTADFKIWKDALGSRADVMLKLYPDLNHLFMTGTGKATPAEYEKPGSVAQSVIADISNWINSHCSP
ncbi:MAG: alpha/beta fold hydrolase [Armatimonadota bacterium]